MVSFTEIQLGNNNGEIIDVKGNGFGYSFIIEKKLNDDNVEFWAYSVKSTVIFPFEGFVINKPFLLNDFFPKNATGKDIMSFDVDYYSVLFIQNSGKVFGSGNKRISGYEF